LAQVKNTRALSVFACLLAFSCVAPAHDSEPINTDFASPLARRTANINFDLQHFRHSLDEDVAAFGLEYGLARRMQVAIGVPLSRTVIGPGQSVMGAGNLSLSYRYLIAGGNDKPFALSLNPEIGLPTGNSVTGGAYTAGGSLNLDAHRGDNFWFHSNWGYETPVSRFVEKEQDFNFAVAGMYELTEQWHPVLELFGQHDFSSSTTQLSLAPEMIFSAGEHWEVKAAVPIGPPRAHPPLDFSCGSPGKLGHPAASDLTALCRKAHLQRNGA
jgi:hypothetical protein